MRSVVGIAGFMLAIVSPTIASAATIEEVAHCRAIPQLAERLNCFKSLKPGPRTKAQDAASAMKQHARSSNVKDAGSRSNAKQAVPAKAPADTEQAAPAKTDEAAPARQSKRHRQRRTRLHRRRQSKRHRRRRTRLHRQKQRRQLKRIQVKLYFPRRRTIPRPPPRLIVSALLVDRCVWILRPSLR